jgi:cell division protein FtsB
MARLKTLNNLNYYIMDKTSKVIEMTLKEQIEWIGSMSPQEAVQEAYKYPGEFGAKIGNVYLSLNKLESTESELSTLKQENEILRRSLEIYSQNKEILKKANEAISEENKSLKREVKRLNAENDICKMAWSAEMDENTKLKKENFDLKREVREFAEWASGNGWYFNAEINVWIYINYTALGISSEEKTTEELHTLYKQK